GPQRPAARAEGGDQQQPAADPHVLEEFGLAHARGHGVGHPQKSCSSTLTTIRYANMIAAAARAPAPSSRQSTPSASMGSAAPRSGGMNRSPCRDMYEAWPSHPPIFPSAPWMKISAINTRASSGSRPSWIVLTLSMLIMSII